MGEQLSLWEAERGYELWAAYGGWVPVEPGSVARGIFDGLGAQLETMRVLGGRSDLRLRRSERSEHPCVWVTDGCPDEGGMRLERLPGERGSRSERQLEEAAAWRVDLVPVADSQLGEWVRAAGGSFRVGSMQEVLDGRGLSWQELQEPGLWAACVPVGLPVSVVDDGGSTRGACEALGSPIMPVMSSWRRTLEAPADERLRSAQKQRPVHFH